MKAISLAILALFAFAMGAALGPALMLFAKPAEYKKPPEGTSTVDAMIAYKQIVLDCAQLINQSTPRAVVTEGCREGSLRACLDQTFLDLPTEGPCADPRYRAEAEALLRAYDARLLVLIKRDL